MHCSILIFPVFLAIIVRAAESGIWFTNNHSNPMHISSDWAKQDGPKPPTAADRWIEPGGRTFFEARASTSPKYFIGPVPNNRSPRVGHHRDHNTIVEATFGAHGLDHTYFDIDVEKGFSVPIWCKGIGDDVVNGEGCLEDLLQACPFNDRHYDIDTGIYDYCAGVKTAESLAVRASLCPRIYVIHDDHATKTLIKKGNTIECTIENPKTLPWIGERTRPQQT